MKNNPQDYANLASLLSGWFHQDFDLSGETIEEIIGAFKKTTDPAETEAICADIAAFLRNGDDTIEAKFLTTFNPDIDPSGFEGSTRSFLEKIRRLLGGG